MKAAVITVSDRAFKGEYEDLSGPEIEKILKELVPGIIVERLIVPDEHQDILQGLQQFAASKGGPQTDIIITTGGTGIGPRDITPDITRAYCDKDLPGLAEILRARSYEETSAAMFSRGYAGIKGKTIIINFPGSLKAVRLCTKVVAPELDHGIRMIQGQGH